MPLDPIGTLFANSWKRFEERFSVLIAIFAVPTVLVILVDLLFAQKMPGANLLGGVIEIINLVVSFIAAIALISAIGKETNFVESCKVGIKLFWQYIWIAILMCLALLGGTIMFVIPGIILAVQLAFSSYVLVLEDRHGMAALAESRTYVKGHWWSFVGRSLLLVLLVIVVGLVILAPLAILLGGVAGTILYLLFLLFVTPFMISYQYEIFDNLRRLKPNAHEQTVKTDSAFLKVSLAFGILGAILIPICIIVAIAFFGSNSSPHRYQYQYPSISGNDGYNS